MTCMDAKKALSAARKVAKVSKPTEEAIRKAAHKGLLSVSFKTLDETEITALKCLNYWITIKSHSIEVGWG